MIERLLLVVVPVVLVTVLGWWIAGRRRPDLADVNRLNMDWFTPALIIVSLSSREFDLRSAWPVALASVVVVLGSGVVAWGAARVLEVDARDFVPSMMFNNCGNMGLPLAYLAFGAEGLQVMVVLFVTSNLLMFTVGTRLVRGRVAWGEALANPMVLATVAGALLGATRVEIPAMVAPALRMLADLCVPLMLLSLGVRMRDLRPADWKLPLAGAVVCPLSGLVIAPLAIALLPLTDIQEGALWVFAALPPAVLNFLMAERYQRASQQVASIVLVGNLASLVVVPPVLAYAMAR